MLGSTRSGATCSEPICIRRHPTTTAFEVCLSLISTRPRRTDRSSVQFLPVVGWSSKAKRITWVTRPRYTWGLSKVLDRSTCHEAFRCIHTTCPFVEFCNIENSILEQTVIDLKDYIQSHFYVFRALIGSLFNLQTLAHQYLDEQVTLLELEYQPTEC